MNYKRKKNAKLRSRWPCLRLMNPNEWVVSKSSRVKLNLKLVKLPS
jgi:hypothetical protein